MKRITNFAATVLRSLGSPKPPIRVTEYLEKHADVRYDTLPLGLHGLLVRRAKARPLVFIEEGIAARRKRFTAGHELGHILIPWHSGTIACFEEDLLERDSPAALMEAEANEFASNILLPSSWLHSYLEVPIDDLAGALLQCSEDSDVSIAAVLMGARRVLEFPAVMAVLGSGHVEAAASTASWHGSKIGRWTRDPVKEIRRSSTTFKRLRIAADRELLIGIHESDIPAGRPARDSKVILTGLLQEVYENAIERRRISTRVNGIVGSANTRVTSREVEVIYSTLRQRFGDREFVELTSHHDFEEFLLAKAYELAER